VTDSTGEAPNGVLRLDFNPRVIVQFDGSVVTSNGGFGRHFVPDQCPSLPRARKTCEITRDLLE
jgi:hypothetical protein